MNSVILGRQNSTCLNLDNFHTDLFKDGMKIPSEIYSRMIRKTSHIESKQDYNFSELFIYLSHKFDLI